jgi:cytochrome P450
MTAVDQPALEFPLTRTCPFEPPTEYRRIREDDTLTKVRLPNGRQAWVVARHEHVRRVLNDPRFSADRFHPDFPRLVAGQNPLLQSEDERSMIAMDAPEHGRARRAVLGEFTVRRLEALRPRIQEIVDERIDAMLAAPKPVDLVRELSLPVPSLVICEMLGVPYADHEFFQTNTAVMINRLVGPDSRRAAFDRIRGYIADLVTRKETDPPDDLLGRQIVKLRAEGTYRRGALVGLGFLLLLAGHETTANMISLGTLGLLTNPAELARIAADPDTTADAVEEMLRYFTIVDGATSRLCVEDVEIGGVTIRAGEGVLALAYAANRDSTAFDDPDSFDVGRGARHHVAFGFGPHQCLGQNLARMELRIVFDTLVRRVPGLRLAANVDDLPFKDDAAIYGLYGLPVTW